jgi:membrane-associated protease RseP (regulator of RpoE activity)
MKRPTWGKLAAATLLLAAPATAIVVGQSGFANADEDAEGRIVEISPSGDELPPAENAEEEAAAEAPKYWIGLQGRPIDSPVLRTHLQLADDVGVLVENVVPDSPAAKAGLRQHDIIINVNGEPIGDLTALQQVVAEGGAKKAIELKVIRLAKETKISVTPEERPADLQVNVPGGEGFGAQGGMGDIDALLRQFQQGGIPGGVRVFGPGMMPGGRPFDPNQVPNGVSVSITREGDGPAQITVKKGDQTWKLNSDDEKALKKLPDDVRPFVTQMLEGSRPGQPGQLGATRFNFRDFQNLLPNDLGEFDMEIGGLPDQQALQKRAAEARKRTEEASRRMLERMEEMEKRMQKMQKQMQEKSAPDRTNDQDDASQT